MSVDVTVERVVRAARPDVAAYVADNRNDPEWIGGISESELLGDPPVRVGSRVRRVASFMGRRVEYVNEVIRLDPGSVLEMRSVVSPFPMEVAYGFEDAPWGTRVRIRVAGEPSAWYRVAAPVLSAGVRRSVARDLRRLADRFERGAGAPSRSG